MIFSSYYFLLIAPEWANEFRLKEPQSSLNLICLPFFFLSNEWPDLTFGGHFHCSLFLHGYWCKPSSVPYYLIPGNIIKVFSFIIPISISSAHPIQDTLINFTSYLRTNDDFHFKNHVWVLGTQSRVFSNWPQTYFSRSISTSTYYVCAWKTAQ